ncbi:hypothetical protein [Paracoccus sp. (in: a-proteobacteria)]|uniref:hypothetical protein n=1 Tax=Paracoccus sp. TaxID=267 RepID=UPI003A8482FD
MEENFRHTLMLSDGDFSTFVPRPISAAFFAAIALILLTQRIASLAERRHAARDGQS